MRIAEKFGKEVEMPLTLKKKDGKKKTLNLERYRMETLCQVTERERESGGRRETEAKGSVERDEVKEGKERGMVSSKEVERGGRRGGKSGRRETVRGKESDKK